MITNFKNFITNLIGFFFFLFAMGEVLIESRITHILTYLVIAFALFRFENAKLQSIVNLIIRTGINYFKKK